MLLYPRPERFLSAAGEGGMTSALIVANVVLSAALGADGIEFIKKIDGACLLDVIEHQTKLGSRLAHESSN